MRIPRATALTAIPAAGIAAVAVRQLRPSHPTPPPTSGTFTQHSATIDGRRRTWGHYRPAGAPAAILLVLHGSHGDGDRIRRATGRQFDALADTRGLHVLYPDGVRGNWNECRRGGDFPAKRLNIDDVGFLRALAHGVDPRLPVIATGFSSGGQMTTRLALEAPDLVAAIAPVAANPPTPDNLRGRDAGRAVPAFFVTGTADPMNPYEGGTVALHGLGRRGTVRSATDGAAWFAGRTGTVEGPTVTRLDDGSELRKWQSRQPVWLLSVSGGGHQYPAPGQRGPRYLGPSVDLDVPALVTDFLLTNATTARNAQKPE